MKKIVLSFILVVFLVVVVIDYFSPVVLASAGQCSSGPCSCTCSGPGICNCTSGNNACSCYCEGPNGSSSSCGKEEMEQRE